MVIIGNAHSVILAWDWFLCYIYIKQKVSISPTEQLLAIIKATLMAASGFVILCTLLIWTDLFSFFYIWLHPQILFLCEAKYIVAVFFILTQRGRQVVRAEVEQWELPEMLSDRHTSAATITTSGRIFFVTALLHLLWTVTCVPWTVVEVVHHCLVSYFCIIFSGIEFRFLKNKNYVLYVLMHSIHPLYKIIIW